MEATIESVQEVTHAPSGGVVSYFAIIGVVALASGFSLLSGESVPESLELPGNLAIVFGALLAAEGVVSIGTSVWLDGIRDKVDPKPNPIVGRLEGGPRPTPQTGSTKRDHLEHLATLDAAVAIVNGANATEAKTVMMGYLRNEAWTSNLASRMGIHEDIVEPAEVLPTYVPDTTYSLGPIIRRAQDAGVIVSEVTAIEARFISDLYREADKSKATILASL